MSNLDFGLKVFSATSPAVIAFIVAMSNWRQAADRRAVDRRTLLLAEQRLQLDLLDRRMRSLDELESIHGGIYNKNWSADDLIAARAAIERAGLLFPKEKRPDFRSFIDDVGRAQNRLASSAEKRANGDNDGADADLAVARDARSAAWYQLRVSIDGLRNLTRVVSPTLASDR